MTKFVPYLADELIEGDAALLLAEYAHARGIVGPAPGKPGRILEDLAGCVLGGDAMDGG
jgi:hypothetical protein